jgi:hypothetical protein
MRLASAQKRLQGLVTTLREQVPSWGKPRARPPERFAVGGPLDAINDGFHEAYDRTKHEVRRDVPVFVVLADELITFIRGERVAYSFAPRAFHVIKSVTHAPLALYATLARLEGATLDAAARESLSAHQARVASALARVDDDARELTQRTRDDLRDVLRACLLFFEGVRDRVPLDALEVFARPLGPALLRLADDATALQLRALDEHVEQALEGLTAEDLTRLHVVVAGDHQARRRSLAMQYFCKRLDEPAEHEVRVTYAEGVADEQGALSLVGTQRLDRALGRAFFGNAARLQRDILGDAAKARLAAAVLRPIG